MGWLTLLTFIFEWVSLCTEELTVRRNLVCSTVGGNTNIITEIPGNYAVRETQEWRCSTGQKTKVMFLQKLVSVFLFYYNSRFIFSLLGFSTPLLAFCISRPFYSPSHQMGDNKSAASPVVGEFSLWHSNSWEKFYHCKLPQAASRASHTTQNYFRRRNISSVIYSSFHPTCLLTIIYYYVNSLPESCMPLSNYQK